MELFSGNLLNKIIQHSGNRQECEGESEGRKFKREVFVELYAQPGHDENGGTHLQAHGRETDVRIKLFFRRVFR